MNCPHCSKEIQNKAAIFCPYCAKSLNYTSKSTGYRIPAVIFTILASLITISVGSLMFLGLINSNNYAYYDSWFQTAFLLGGINIICFVLGITGTILLIQRKNFKFSVLGISSLIIAGMATFFGIMITSDGRIHSAILFGVPIIVLSILGIIFTLISKKEFY